MDLAIVNYNTPELTRAAIKSVWKHTPDCKVTVFDNSDRAPFPEMDGVFVMDNTIGQLIDFDALLNNFPDKQNTTTNNWGSAKHCFTIDYLWDVFPCGFLLMDSDALVKKDISGLVQPGKAFSGEVYQNLGCALEMVPRVLPFLCWINVPVCIQAGIRYFDNERNWKLQPGGPLTLYDTGASFWEDCANKMLPYNRIKVGDYIEHLGGGSYRRTGHQEWLDKYRNLYE